MCTVTCKDMITKVMLLSNAACYEMFSVYIFAICKNETITCLVTISIVSVQFSSFRAPGKTLFVDSFSKLFIGSH